MIYVIAGVILGVLAGLNLNIVYDPDFAVYISLAVLAILNTIFDLLNENTTGELTPVKGIVFLIRDLGFGLLMGFVGEQLGLPIYLAAVFAFGNNIYKNLRTMINFALEKYQKNK
jgi:small basic protein